MTLKGIILITFAVLGAIMNYASKPLHNKTGIGELKIKVSALIIVLVCVVLLFILGK